MKKTEIINAIKNSKSMEEAAKTLGLDRRELFRRRQALGIIGIQAGENIRKQKEKEEKKDNKFVIPENKNLVNKFEGRFKLQSDLSLSRYKRFVITSVQNDTLVNKDFYTALKVYCKQIKAKLLVLPTYYKATKQSTFMVDKEDMFYSDIQLNNSLKIMCNLNVLPSIVSPLAGLDPLSKGDTMIIPHPQLAMKNMPVLADYPAQMWTTGSISVKDVYLKTKTGAKATFNHSLGALRVDLGEGDSFSIRNLNCDSNNGFYDALEDGLYYFNKDGSTDGHRAEAIYLGDTHVGVVDPGVVKATYTNKDSISAIFKPKYFLHGDLVDTSSISHHDNKNILNQFAKYAVQKNSVEKEIYQAFDFLKQYTPQNAKALIIGSNHNDHVMQWLQESNPKHDLVNAKFYHKMMYLMMDSVQETANGYSYPNLLQLIMKNSDYASLLDRVEFLGRRNSYKIKDIEISLHGDKGINGSRGGPNQFRRLSTKSIVGHSHSASIEGGCYTVGTSSMRDLSYNAGISTWSHSHVIIFENGSRMMLTIINGKWRV